MLDTLLMLLFDLKIDDDEDEMMMKYFAETYLDDDCLLNSLFDDPHLDISLRGCLSSTSAGDPDLDTPPVNNLLLTPLLGLGLSFCFPSSILFITASHLLGFLTLGVFCLAFSSFSFSIA